MSQQQQQLQFTTRTYNH